MLFLVFIFNDHNLAENLTNFAENLKIVEPREVHGARFFQLQGLQESGGQDCQGKVKGQGLVEH